VGALPAHACGGHVVTVSGRLHVGKPVTQCTRIAVRPLSAYMLVGAELLGVIAAQIPGRRRYQGRPPASCHPGGDRVCFPGPRRQGEGERRPFRQTGQRVGKSLASAS